MLASLVTSAVIWNSRDCGVLDQMEFSETTVPYLNIYLTASIKTCYLHKYSQTSVRIQLIKNFIVNELFTGIYNWLFSDIDFLLHFCDFHFVPIVFDESISYVSVPFFLSKTFQRLESFSFAKEAENRD